MRWGEARIPRRTLLRALVFSVLLWFTVSGPLWILASVLASLAMSLMSLPIGIVYLLVSFLLLQVGITPTDNPSLVQAIVMTVWASVLSLAGLSRRGAP
jgi:hypothetical protein